MGSGRDIEVAEFVDPWGDDVEIGARDRAGGIDIGDTEAAGNERSLLRDVALDEATGVRPTRPARAGRTRAAWLGEVEREGRSLSACRDSYEPMASDSDTDPARSHISGWRRQAEE